MKVLTLCALLGMSGSLFAGEIGCVYQAGRNAQIMKAGQDQPWRAVKKAMPFSEGDRVKTGNGGFCEILLKDGTFIRVDEGSELSASELQLSAAGRTYSFSLLLGKAMWLAAKVKAAFVSKFEVRTAAAVCAVRGTAFAVSVSSNDTSVGLFEGSMSVAAGSDSKEITPGTEATASNGAVAVQARLSRLMEKENKRYAKLKDRVEDLRKRLAKRDDFIDSYLDAQGRKVSDYEKRQAERLEKRGK